MEEGTTGGGGEEKKKKRPDDGRLECRMGTAWPLKKKKMIFLVWNWFRRESGTRKRRAKPDPGAPRPAGLRQRQRPEPRLPRGAAAPQTSVSQSGRQSGRQAVVFCWWCWWLVCFFCFVLFFTFINLLLCEHMLLCLSQRTICGSFSSSSIVSWGSNSGHQA